MCGIAGYLGERARGPQADVVLRRMCDALAHRGPDDEGQWIDAQAGVALGHRRLSILDLSQEGHQPMFCQCGRHVISFNGEIYNHLLLAGELQARGVKFRGRSDTETLVESICTWGIEDTLERIDGMFAFAHWDVSQQVLHLARDRAGIKPLYYGMAGDTFMFASELKALASHPDFRPRVDRQALSMYFRLEYVPPPLSIYEGIGKLAPGTFVQIRPGPKPVVGGQTAYWSLRSIAEEGFREPLDLSDADATDCLEELLKKSVRLQTVADVPVGAFLSGGIDSSAVVAILQSVSKEPVRTFTIGFSDARVDEAPYARAIAEHLGTRHSEFYVRPEEMQEQISRLPTLYDEPFSEPSALPTFVLSRVARQDVKVALTGDGGDELFGGYSWYNRFQQLYSIHQKIPHPLGRALANIINGVGESEWLVGTIAKASPRAGKILGTQHHHLAATLTSRSRTDLFFSLRSLWPDAGRLVRGSGQRALTGMTAGEDTLGLDERRLAMYLDMGSFLPEHPLTKVDRASMAVSLEARVPLLDREIIEFAWRLPLSQRIGRSTTKFLLKQVIYRHLPRALVDRPKVGFEVPIDSWLRGPLRDWAGTVLSPARLEPQGYLDARRVQRVWSEHQAGKQNWGRALWSVLVFQLWLDSMEGRG